MRQVGRHTFSNLAQSSQCPDEQRQLAQTPPSSYLNAEISRSAVPSRRYPSRTLTVAHHEVDFYLIKMENSRVTVSISSGGICSCKGMTCTVYHSSTVPGSRMPLCGMVCTGITELEGEDGYRAP